MNTTTVNTLNKKAFKVIATIDGKSWERKGTTLTAIDEASARDKAINVLRLKPEHKIELQPREVFEVGAKLETSNYPYGRLKCTAFFNVEVTKNGFREVFQTINPKDGRINKPKKSTYYEMILPCVDSNEHYSFCGHNSFNGTDEINTGLHFLNDFFELFKVEQIKNIATSIYGSMVVNIKAQSIYCGTDIELLKPLYVEKFATLKTIMNNGENHFLECLLDSGKIEALKVPNYNPFTVKSY